MVLVENNRERQGLLTTPHGNVKKVKVYNSNIHDNQQHESNSSNITRSRMLNNETENARRSWRNDKVLLLQILTAFYGFFVTGLSDQTIGSLLPSYQSHYHLSDVQASLLFCIQFAGCLMSASLNDYLHRKVGAHGVGLIGTSISTINFLIAFTKPPFMFLLLAYVFAGIGNGCVDAAWNAHISKLDNNNEIMGILHACYGVGSLTTPIIVTILLSNKMDWSWTFGVLASLSFLTIIFVFFSFREETGEKYLEEVKNHQSKFEAEDESSNSAGDNTTKKETNILKLALSHKVIWCLALYLFLYCGAEVGIGGWAVSYMIRVRHGSKEKMGIIATFFWSGITIGRLVLGFVTGQFAGKENNVATVYAMISLLFFLLFTLVPGDSLLMSGATLMASGIFLGPLYPTVVIYARRLLPGHLYLAGIGFAAAFAGCGAALFPALVGFLAERFGSLIVFGPAVCTVLTLMILVWIITPYVGRKQNPNLNTV